MTKLQELRKAKGLTQKQLATTSGLALGQVQKYESGERDINKAQLVTAVALAKALGCKAEDLIED